MTGISSDRLQTGPKPRTGVLGPGQNNKKLSLHEDQWVCQKTIPLIAKIQNLRVWLTIFFCQWQSRNLLPILHAMRTFWYQNGNGFWGLFQFIGKEKKRIQSLIGDFLGENCLCLGG